MNAVPNVQPLGKFITPKVDPLQAKIKQNMEVHHSRQADRPVHSAKLLDSK